jgi:Tol biopolymer transport system component
MRLASVCRRRTRGSSNACRPSLAPASVTRLGERRGLLAGRCRPKRQSRWLWNRHWKWQILLPHSRPVSPNALTGTPAQVTTDPGQDRDPSWVASGIAFETLRPAVSDTYEIFTTSAAGGTERNLTNSAFSDNHPAWSEDGTRVAFQRRLSRPGGAQWDIVVIDVASGAATNLTNSADADECMPAWSADGSKLAFYKGAPGACDTGGASTVASDIWVMDRNGSNGRQLTSNAQRNVDPAWSPDGTRIAWSSNRDGDYEIYVMQASGAGVQQFTFNNTPDMAPDWQPGSGSNSASDVRVFLPIVAGP